MKSVLYVAAALMIGASIYGFVDYSKTSRHKEFKTMYDQPEVKEPVVAEEKKQTDIVSPETISKKEQAEMINGQEVKEPLGKIKKKKRTINYESFSRAPLKERIEVVIPERKKMKTKEQ
jgi:hypothetical protein